MKQASTCLQVPPVARPSSTAVAPRRAWKGLPPLALAAILMLVCGCATTWQPGADTSADALRARAVTASAQDVRVSAAVLSADDSRRMLGADIPATGVQPVWIEVQNGSRRALWLLRAGVDPDYFSPLEVAWSLHAKLAGDRNAKIDDWFRAQEFTNPILPGETRSGVVFTNPQPKTRVLNVDLVASGLLIPFSLFLPVPGSEADDIIAKLSGLYTEAQVTDYQDAGALREALERLPCCASDARGDPSGEPLNLVVVGELSDLGAAVSRRGFRRNTMQLDDAQRLYGRRPDIVLRKYAQGGAPPTWVRAWLAPLRFQGRPVFVAQVGRPRGGRFVADDDDATRMLHPDVDEARGLLIEDMLYSGGFAKLGFVEGVGAASASAARVTAQGASWYTDGLRAVAFMATRPLGLSDVEILDWAPYLQRRESDAAARIKATEH